MFARIRKMQEENEGGFTLIELLVVIIIIGILAAIAIPTFLRQREKGWLAAVKSDVKNAATAEESYGTENDGTYTTDGALLRGSTGEGFNPSNGVTVKVTMGANNTSYILCGNHSKLGTKNVSYNSLDGKLVQGNGACAGTDISTAAAPVAP